MKKTFLVTIVGRPNVGKSTLFNRIARKRKALTFGRPGITRDAVSEKVTVDGKTFELVDTGGYIPEAEEELARLVTEQVERAIDRSDLILFVMDGKEGPTSIEREILERLREGEKEFLVVLNKSDSRKFSENLPLFFEMGVGEFIEVSAEHGTGVEEVIHQILTRIEGGSDGDEEKRAESGIRVALIGRPNVGKSTLFNTIIGQERVIASPIPGTTRDTIDVEVEVGGTKFVFLDTAGIRPRRKTTDAVDKITSIRSIKSIGRAHLVVLVVDSTEGVTHNDLQILRYVIDEGRGVVLAANKMDLIKSGEVPSLLSRMEDDLSFARFVPIVPLSAVTGKGVRELIREMKRVHRNFQKRVKTSELNRLVGERV
ncbi:MAG: ribosome biogenesis GTPase Der, partial [Deltaproteobacteria bacterium]